MLGQKTRRTKLPWKVVQVGSNPQYAWVKDKVFEVPKCHLNYHVDVKIITCA